MPQLSTTRVDKNRGAILRVKEGYNPNSSSVGSQIPYFFAFAMGSGIVTLLVMNILAGFDRQIKKAAQKEPSVNNENN